MGFADELRRRAAALNRRIAFVEAHDERVRSVVEELARTGMAQPVVIHDSKTGEKPVVPGSAELIDAARHGDSQAVQETILQRWAGADEREAARLSRDPLVCATALLRLGRVDGVVAGAIHNTADVVRAAIRIVGPAPGVTSVSSAFYMVVPPFRGGDAEVLTFADCAVIVSPTPEQLAGIAIAAARDRRAIVGDEPAVALLSYSTYGSASGPSVELAREALAIIRNLEPALIVDGELQGDAALARDVCDRKSPSSPVQGKANVLIFPDLDAGNIAYKLVQRIARAGAIGPILQGLTRPCNDLSRGSTRDDILNVAAITALQTSVPAN